MTPAAASSNPSRSTPTPAEPACLPHVSPFDAASFLRLPEKRKKKKTHPGGHPERRKIFPIQKTGEEVKQEREKKKSSTSENAVSNDRVAQRLHANYIIVMVRKR